MNAQEIMSLVHPSVLVHLGEDLRAASNGNVVKAGSLAAIQLRHTDYWGTEIAVWNEPEPVGGPAYIICTPGDLERCNVRPATADEERAWIRRGQS